MNLNLKRIWDFTDKKMTELISISDYKEPCYILSNGKLFNILQIKTKNLTSANEEEIEMDVLHFTRLYKTYSSDLKFIALNFPTETKIQQEYVKHKISTTANTINIEHLKIKLSQLEWIEKNRTDREFYLMFFSDDELKYKDNLAIIQKNIGEHIHELDKDKKNQVLYKINNKNSSIFI